MAKQIPINVTQDRDGTYVLRLEIADAAPRRYSDIVDIWRALDVLDAPSDAKVLLAQ